MTQRGPILVMLVLALSRTELADRWEGLAINVEG